ncbi:hypothetical protein RSAG8_11700, partial [Rhizoctonia solani AG-8 WAC10335]
MPTTTSDWVRTPISRLIGRAAEQQGGLLTGSDPTEYNTHDPIRCPFEPQFVCVQG